MNEEFELPDGPCSLSDIQDWLKYVWEKHETVTDNHSILICLNEIENRIMFKRKTGYYLELLMLEKMKLVKSTKSKINKGKNGENVPHLEISELVSIHCNIVNNDYQQNWKVLEAFIPKLLG